MATLSEIMALKQQSNPYAGLAQLGNTVADIMRSRKQSQQAEAAKENQAQAASLLAQAQQNPEQGQQLFAQAYNLAPTFVSGFVKAQKDRAGAGIESRKFNLREEDQRLRKLQIEQREETNELKRKELGLKIEAQKQKVDTVKREKEKEAAEVNRSIESSMDLVDRMLASEGLDKAVGIKSLVGSVPGGDAANFEALHDQLTGRQFLNSVQQMTGMGSLSDAEGKKIAAAAEALSLSQSPDAYRESLQRIRDSLATRKEAGTYNNSDKDDIESNVVEWGSL